MKNNLFTFATSELSQDAFICWCLNWINYPNEILYPMAKDIFSNLLKEEKNLENEEIEIRRQYKKIDVLVILKNSKKAYIIEDKTNTFENNQIIRYKEAIKNEIDTIKTVYFKTGFWFSDDDSVLADIKINREDFLGILNKYRGKNQILDDYCEYFERVTESEEKEKNYLISEEELTQKKYWELNIARSIITQYQFMRYIFSKRYIRSGRSIGGGVYTQYDILKDKVFSDTKNENLSEDKRTYSVFWRIDSKDKIEKIIENNCLDLQIVKCKFYDYWEPNLLIIPLRNYLISKEKCDKLVECIRIIDRELRK